MSIEMDPLLNVQKNLGQLQDSNRAHEIRPSERCHWCEGTGNQLYRMYQQCSCCGGKGRLMDHRCDKHPMCPNVLPEAPNRE